MYISALLTPSKESTLARTESTVNTFSPKSTNINQSLGSMTLGCFPEIPSTYAH